ncbi:diguanylate cyclase [Acetobacter estunensis NRIC 0472]|uniref:EAL domain-containing protein n=1 Tax=Acetobacter estunensis TaxID=104097 RepID=A0A967B7Z6_9PROT|nr:EAL domain-containing protein [Acetobacter estunensis]NHO53846.1 EAL domain-containing protein [Acetobacter estunensis]GBQ24573.1 diguanylate cyclase [Acetobacter estunensis NRIC 0472]
MPDLLRELAAHNPLFLAGATLLCAATMLISVRMICRAAMARRRSQRLTRLFLAAAVAANGVWATHFMAMLGRQSAVQTAYDLPLTLFSVIVACGFFLAAWWVEIRTKGGSRSPLTALLMTAAVGGMHYIGIAAITSDASTHVQPLRIGLSLGSGFLLFLLGTWLLREERGHRRAFAAVAWILGVVLLHFIGMPADHMTAAMSHAAHRADSVSLAAMVMGGSGSFLGLALVFLLLEYRGVRHRNEENLRARHFADVAIEGLIITSGGAIVDANAAFWELVGAARPDVGLVRSRLPDLQTEDDVQALVRQEKPREMVMVRADGETIPVEVYGRHVSWQGKNRDVLAILDLRARKEAEMALQELAVRDMLTGIGNRAFFVSTLTDILEHGKRHGRYLAVFLVDVDRFKSINETCGHATGDAVLGAIARRLQLLVPQGAISARIAGDEFAVAFDVTERDAGEFAVYLAHQLRMPLPDHPDELPVSVSVGFVMSSDETPDGDTLLHRSGIALLAAKQAGRGNAREYDQSFDTSIRERIRMEREIRQALDREEFFLEYQPIMSTGDHCLTGYEALVRWQHPERGRVPPDQFIGVAEECGLIADLGEWVVRRACADAVSWKNGLGVSVNVSPVQFAMSDLPAVISAALGDSGLSPDRLSVEITENTLLQGRENVRILRQLREIGVGIVMDDFGTGYSSLSYLREFQFDRIKIDRSFIGDMLRERQSAGIVDLILSLGRVLGVDIVAEGIETADQLSYLEARACTLVQGYFIGRPSREIAPAPSAAALAVSP